jgi:hypothetical protein
MGKSTSLLLTFTARLSPEGVTVWISSYIFIWTFEYRITSTTTVLKYVAVVSIPTWNTQKTSIPQVNCKTSPPPVSYSRCVFI